jgi:hypothetical protein
MSGGAATAAAKPFSRLEPMTRPSRVELMRRFFHELGQTGTGGETEAAIEINTRACEAILADQIQLFDKFHAQQGDGALVIRLAGDERTAYYVPLEGFCEDLLAAEQSQDFKGSGFLREVIRAIKTTNTQDSALILLIDKSQASLLPVPRVYPARAIQELQESNVL